MSSIDPLDFIFGVVIGDILGAPLTDGDLSMTGPVCSAAVIASLHFALSLIALKTPRFRRVIEEEPIIELVSAGVTQEDIINVIQAHNVAMPGGTVADGELSLTTRNAWTTFLFPST